MKDHVRRCAGPYSRSGSEEPSFLAHIFQRAVIRSIGKQLKGNVELQRIYDEHLDPCSASLLPTAAAWQPSLGQALAMSRKGDVHGAIAASMFAMHNLGYEATWSMSFPERQRLGLGGHLFDASGRLDISAGAGFVEMSSTECLEPICLEWRSDGRLTSAGPVGEDWGYSPPKYIEFPAFRDVYLQPWQEPDNSRELVDVVLAWPPESATTRSNGRPRDPEFIATDIEKTLVVLSSLEGGYLEWIRPLLRGIVTMPLLDDGMRQSASYVEHAGVFTCGFPTPAEALAEVVVHEVSHQYLMLLSTMCPLVSDTKGAVYFSSLKKLHRTLDRVLLAFHACANMLGFWLDLVEKSGVTKSRSDEIGLMGSHVSDLGQTLKRANGLTAAGQMLFDTQLDALHRKGWRLGANYG